MVTLQAYVLAAALAASSDLVLLDFGADWCAPCRGMEPVVRQLHDAGYPVQRVNVDRNPDLAQRFNIGPIPCFVLLRDGREVQRSVGATSYEQLVQMFQQAGYRPSSSGGTVRGQSPDRVELPHAAGQTSGVPSPHDVGVDPRRVASDNRLVGAGLDSTAQPASRVPGPVVSSRQAQQTALLATVRLRVVDAQGQSKGTGTIIDVHGEEALVLTCGHIFRDSQGKGDIFVELFVPGTRGPVRGQLLAYECDQRDYGLLSFRPDVPVTPVRVATTVYHPRPGEPVFSVGCDHGSDPTVRESAISAVDRYTGPPNIEIHGHPVDGRSGGGLFTADGTIVGICNAADLQEDRGIFAGLPTIHLALDRIGQRRIYLYEEAPDVGLLAESSAPAQPVATTPSAVAQAPAADRTSAPQSLAQGAIAGTRPGEVICVVRQADGSNRLLVIQNPSEELLQRVMAESRQALAESSAIQTDDDRGARPQADLARLPDLATSSSPVIRAQNR